MDLSIVTTMYYSAQHLEEFYRRASAAARRIGADYELIFVNDGSPDDSLEIAVGLYQRDQCVRVIDLSRNFGHYKAMMTGLAHAQGQLVFLIDSDLEEEPELLEAFYSELQASDADVVYGVQQTRKGNFAERISGELYYSLFNLLSTQRVPRNVVTARLMSQRYVASLVAHRDQEIFMLGLWTITGFKQIPLIVQKHSKGSTTYSFRHKIALLVNSITAFSNKPLVLIFYLGCMISFVASLAALYLIVRITFFGALLAGWASLIVSIWLLGGLTIFCLGIIGIYLSKVFTETKQRPYTVIRQFYEHSYEPVSARMLEIEQ
jgi:putative glycosyltransferase